MTITIINNNRKTIHSGLPLMFTPLPYSLGREALNRAY